MAAVIVDEKRLALMMALAAGTITPATLATAQGKLDAAFPDPVGTGGLIVSVFPADATGKRRTLTEAIAADGSKTTVSDVVA